MSPLGIESPERWKRVKAIVAEALATLPDGRPAVLDRSCADDSMLRGEVEALLAAVTDERVPEKDATLGDAEVRTALEGALGDRYEIGRLLGRGGMGAVYLVHDRRLDRPLALKVYRLAQGAGDHRAVGAERFLREIRLTAHLGHPHILTLHDSGNVGGLLYYTMPYVPGESLRARLQRERQLSFAEAVTIASQVAAALEYSHQANVLHRDVKPENILLRDDQAFVADFGIACLIEGLVDERLTASGVSVGTPLYMSPEQVDLGVLDGSCDVYSLGCMLYEMLTGEPPFTGASTSAILAQKLTQEPPRLCTRRRDVPERLDHLVARMMARDPRQRPGDATLLAELEVLRRLTTPAAGVPWSRPAPRVLARSRRAMIGVAAGLLATGGGALAFLRSRGDRTSRRLDPDLVVVAPFATVLSRDAVWREGLAEWFARDLDGAGSLRAVPPSVALRTASQRADRESAMALARSTGAGLVLYGALSPVGLDSAQLLATLVDARAGGIVSERETTGAMDHLTLLTDSLALGMLVDLSNRRGTGTVRPSGALGSSSLPAIRAFLRGDQAFRHAEWDSAQTYYEQAVEQDSTFALALRQLGRLAAWRGMGFGAGRPRADSALLSYAQRASRFAHGLGPRDSLLILADSLTGALAPDLCAQAEPRRRLLRTTSTLTSRFPADAEAWVAHGDALYVCGGYVTLNEPGIGKREMLQAYDSAIVLDPGLAQAYDRTFRLALDLGDTALVLRHAATYLRLRPPAPNAAFLHLITALLRRPMDAAAILDTASAPTVFGAYASLLLYPDSAELQVAVGRRLASTTAAGGTWDSYRGGTNGSDMPAAPLRHRALALAEAYRGHLRTAAARVGTELSPFAARLTSDLALVGAIPAATADSTFRAWLQNVTRSNAEGMASALAWWGARRDTVALLAYLGDVRGLPNTMGALRLTGREQVARGYLALARGDTSTAIALLVGLPSNEWWVEERLVAAHLLATRGRVADAFALLDRGFPYPFATPLRGMWAMDHARLASALGDRAKARASYAYVAQLWREADPELQPIVREARAALVALPPAGARH